MIVYTCELQLLIFDAYSLKDKRSVLKSIMNRTKQKFNISIAEIGSNELHNKAEIGIACLSNQHLLCEQTLQKVMDFIENNYPVEVINYRIEER